MLLANSKHSMLGVEMMQSSNVATYIAQGDVALSVLMTTASTLGAIVMTPLLTKTLAGAYIAVDAKVSAESGAATCIKRNALTYDWCTLLSDVVAPVGQSDCQCNGKMDAWHVKLPDLFQRIGGMPTAAAACPFWLECCSVCI